MNYSSILFRLKELLQLEQVYETSQHPDGIDRLLENGK